MPIAFIKDFSPIYGQIIQLSPMIRCLTAENPSPFTNKGTNSYIIGQKKYAIIDPGPNIDSHFKNLIDAIGDKELSHIFITHCHLDHCALAKRLALATGAKIVAEGAYRLARPHHISENTALEAGSDKNFSPDIFLKDNESIEIADFSLACIATPGHMANHACFALNESGVLFSGDHVMAFATTVIAPPEGNMHDYMNSLDTLLTRHDKVYLPGHGGPVYHPQKFVRAIKAHRKMREKAILNRLKQGDDTIEKIVASIYHTTAKQLHKAAALSVFAHLEDLCERKIVTTTTIPKLNSHYSIS